MTNNLEPDNVKGFSSVNTNTYTASGALDGDTTPGEVKYNIYHDITAGDVDDLNTNLTTEKTRLDSKKTQIDELYETHTRKKHFKTSMADRNNAYWRMFMVILLLSIIIVLLYLFRKNFPLIPSWAMDLILIAVVAGGFIYLFIMYEDIWKRDQVNFSKLDPESPVMARDKKMEETSENLEKGKISLAMNSETPDYCRGAQCCQSGQYFDTSTNKCVENFSNYSPLHAFTPY
jgi:hypothetical protein